MKASACTMIAATLIAAPICFARTHTVRAIQNLPAYGYSQNFGLQAAIDGDSIITFADYYDGRVALLYRRGTDGRWDFNRILLDLVTGGTPPSRTELVMKNGLAAIRLGNTVFISEKVNGAWTDPVGFFGAPQGGGLAISGQRIAVNVDVCRDDTLILEKGTSGTWSATGRVVGPATTCADGREVSLDLNENTLLVRRNAAEVHVYRKYLQEFDWPHVGQFTLPADAAASFGPVALQKGVAVSPGSAIFRRNGGLWNAAGFARPVDYGNGAGFAHRVVFRDGVLITTENWGEMHAYIKPYVYVDNGSGFDHVAILESHGFTDDIDVSGRTVVVTSEEFDQRYVSVFTLPSPIAAPRAIVNDFEARDTSAFELTPGSQFALAQRGSNDVYRQSGLATEAHALLHGSDWPDHQSIEADITPIQAGDGHRWVGLAVRYVDEANFYYLTATNSNALQLKRKVDGVITTLWQTPFTWPINRKYRVRLAVARDLLTVEINGTSRTVVRDATFKRGRAALMAYRTAADFDNVYAAPTAPLNLVWKNYREVWFDWGRPFSFTGGNWELTGDADPDGLSQTTTTGSAYGLIGTDTDEQRVSSLARLDAFNGTDSTVAWFGLLARYVDASNYYYLSVRSSRQLQIRKIVDGQITVLAAAPFTAVPGKFHKVTFDVFGDQLHAYVDGVLVAQAIDGSLPRGRYGIGTYRTAATFQTFIVDQP